MSIVTCPICSEPMDALHQKNKRRFVCSMKCHGERLRQIAAAERPPETWWCADCKEYRPLSEFSPALSRSQCRKHSSAYDAARTRDMKQYLIESLGGRCSSCGYNRCPAAFDFHHPDPSKKDITWSSLRRKTPEVALAQLKQEEVVLLCSNCHREEHYKGSPLPPRQVQRKFDPDSFGSVQ